MRIKSLYIPDYYLLQDFYIEFNNNLSVLIGENGSGKSSIIECLAYIFGHLHKYFVLGEKTAEFIDGYRINYEIDGFDIYIESKYVSSKTNTFQPTIKINDEVLNTSQIKTRYGGFRVFLPEKVILSYSGITEHMKELNKHFEEMFVKKIIRLNNPYSLIPLNLPEDNPFMYVKKEYVAFVILALFVLNSEESQNVLQTIGVDLDGCTTTITLKKPYWAKTDKKDKENNSLWGMTGNIALDFLSGLIIYGIQKDNQVDENIINYEFYGSLMIQDIFHSYFNLRPDQVVSVMDTLLCDDLLESVNITWGDGLSVDRLSEGEKQLIISVGLSLVLNKQNLLFLFDEPDVSLHPKWQQKFISSIRKGLDEESMAIITTHNPILIGDLQKDQIYEIQKGKKIDSDNYSFGRDMNSILEDYFKVDERSKQGHDLIKAFYSAMDEKDYDKAENLLNELKANFGPEDVSTIKAESLFDDLAE